MALRTLHFQENGSFTVMQISDIQDCGALHPRGLRLLESALDIEKPDVVIFTGDQVKGYSPWLLFADPESAPR